MKNIKNYIKVSENISTSGQPSKNDFKKIAQNGFEVVINLATHQPKRGALKDEDKIVSKNGMIYFHIPINWEKPEIERLRFFLDTLYMLEKQNKKIFIHCILNHRVSVFIYRYKKDILGQKNVKLIAPKDFKAPKAWTKILKTKI